MAGNLAPYDINLDLDSYERWRQIIIDYVV